MSEGRKLLLAVLERTSVLFVAARCGVTIGAVKHWRAGRNGPGPRSKRELFRSYGIPIDSWGKYEV